MKRKMALLFAVLLLAASIPIYAFAADNPDADDNTGIVLQYSLAFTGSGTQDDPFYGELNYRSGKIDTTTIKTVNPLATINGGANTYTVSLNYGWNDIVFYVTSADGTKTSYYHVRWSRTKQNRTEHLKNGDVYTEPAKSADDASGKIVHLDPNETYEYQISGDAQWTCVSGVSEITGLTPGTYRVRYGESATHLADSGSDYINVFVGRSDQLYSIINNTDLEMETPQAVAAGQRADFKIKLENSSRPILDMDVKYSHITGEWATSSGAKYYITDYKTENGAVYASGYFIINTYNASAENCELLINGVTFFDEDYYAVAQPENVFLSAKITPADESDTVVFENSILYKNNSQITIALSAANGSGIDSISHFDVCLNDGTVVASSADGTAVTVTVTGDLHIGNIGIVYTPADFTAMEEQLARLDGIDLTLYTDDTRVAVEERTALAQQMYKLYAKDQALVDEFVPTLKAAIDSLVPKDGIFTDIENNQALIPSDNSLYTEESWARLMQAATAAQTAVDENWNRLRQDEIDALASELKAAIHALEYKAADYTAVDEAIANAEKLDPKDYKDFSAVEAAINAVDRTKNITEQAEVDAMAKAINDALAMLEKAETPAQQESTTTAQTSGRDTATKSPDTGAEFILPAASTALVSAAAILLLRKRRKDGSN